MLQPMVSIQPLDSRSSTADTRQTISNPQIHNHSPHHQYLKSCHLVKPLHHLYPAHPLRAPDRKCLLPNALRKASSKVRQLQDLSAMAQFPPLMFSLLKTTSSTCACSKHS